MQPTSIEKNEQAQADMNEYIAWVLCRNYFNKAGIKTKSVKVQKSLTGEIILFFRENDMSLWANNSIIDEHFRYFPLENGCSIQIDLTRKLKCPEGPTLFSDE